VDREDVCADSNSIERNRLDNDPEFYKSLLRLFVKNNRNKFGDIVKAIASNDFKLAHRLTHTLKGNAGQLEKVSLQKAAADVELQLKDGRNHVTEESLNRLKIELDNAISSFSAEISPASDESSARTNNSDRELLSFKDTRELFEKLEPLLRSGNPECLNYINELRMIPGSANLREQIIQQIEDFNFEAALYTLAELK
jgi:HPt (histidine-containing phosphotransfer) domain-containing protein